MSVGSAIIVASISICLLEGLSLLWFTRFFPALLVWILGGTISWIISLNLGLWLADWIHKDVARGQEGMVFGVSEATYLFVAGVASSSLFAVLSSPIATWFSRQLRGRTFITPKLTGVETTQD